MNPRSIRLLAVLWVATCSAMVYAGALVPSLSTELTGYDWSSILFAGGFGLMGGIGATIVRLMSTKVFVLYPWRQLLRDLVVAMIGGAVVYVIFLWLQTVSPSIFNKELRMIAIIIAGASQGRWRDVVSRFAVDGVAAGFARVFPSSGKADPPPTSIQAPISDK